MSGRIGRPFALAAAFSSMLLGVQGASGITFKSTFYGTIVWVSATNCPFQKAGYGFTSEYHPRVASPASENYSGLTTMYTFDGAVYRLNGAAFDSTFRSVVGTYTGTAGQPITGTQIRILQSDPPTVTPSTQFLTLRGQIRTPWGENGTGGQACIVGFLANYFRGKL